MKNLTTAEEVIEALGGVDAVGKRYCEGSANPYKAAYAWLQAGDFPAKTYVAMTEDLKARGYRAPPKLWRMVEKVA